MTGKIDEPSDDRRSSFPFDIRHSMFLVQYSPATFAAWRIKISNNSSRHWKKRVNWYVSKLM